MIRTSHVPNPARRTLMIPFPLPTWYACFDADWTSPQTAAESSPGTLRHGPLTLREMQVGCQTLAFGPDQVNLALFDGYLFDKPELVAALGRQGDSLTEVEIIALAYQRWGDDLFNHLDGGYLAAIWDAQRGRLIAGHDGFSRYPFYYGHRGRKLYFAPTVNALIESRVFARVPNRVNLALRVGGFFTLQDQTFYESIYRLRHAHHLQADLKGGFHVTEYWCPLMPDGEVYLPDQQVLDTFEPLLRQATARCLAVGSDGILLSGGLDSSVIAGLAHEIGQAQGRAPLAAYASTRTPDEPVGYEQTTQRALVDRLGMPYRASSFLDFLDHRDLVTTSIEDLAVYPEPTTLWWVGLYPRFLRSIVDNGSSSLLSGVGADEWLDVDRSAFTDALRALSPSRIRLFLDTISKEAGWRHMPLRRRFSLVARQMIGAYWARWLPESRRTHRLRRLAASLPGWLCPEPALRQTLLQALLDHVNVPELDPRGRVPASYYEHSKRYLWKVLAEASVCETDFLFGRSAGLRVLMPFFDKELVHMLFRASPWVLLHDHRSKTLNRRVARRLFPDLGIADQAKDYMPEEDRAIFKAVQQNVLVSLKAIGSKKLASYDIIRQDKLPYDDGTSPQAMTTDDTYSLYTLLSTEAWLHRQD